MSTPTISHSSIHHRVTYDAFESSPAPAQEGPQNGYFNDQATRELLRLSGEDSLLHAGTYGFKEPGQAPIDITWLENGTYDQRLLPFVPRGYRVASPAFHLQRGQYLVRADARKSLREWLNKALFDSQDLGAKVSLSLPSYALQLVPKLLHPDRSTTMELPYQFQPFFTPSAVRARWVRVHRVIALLEGYINLCQRILAPQEDWKIGSPIGLKLNPKQASDADLQLARAYHFLGLSVEGYTPAETQDAYSLDHAQDALLGRQLGKARSFVSFDTTELELEGTDDDALYYEYIKPDYDQAIYRPDGVKKDRSELRDDIEMAEQDLIQEDPPARSENSSPEPAPPYTPAAPTATRLPGPASVGAPPALRVELGLTTSGLAPPTESTTPVSTSVSATPSAVSSASAASEPSPREGSTSWRPKDPKASTRSRAFHQAASGGPSRRVIREASHYSPPRHRSPSPPGRSSRRNSPSRSRSPGRRSSARLEPRYSSPHRRQRSPSPLDRRPRSPRGSHSSALIPRREFAPPPAVYSESRNVQAQRQQALLLDKATGLMKAMPVLETDFASLGLLVPPQPSATGTWSPTVSSAYRASSPSRSRYLENRPSSPRRRSRSRSPARSNRHSRRSPSPARYSRYSPSPPARHSRRSPSPSARHSRRSPSPPARYSRRPPSPPARHSRYSPPRDQGYQNRGRLTQNFAPQGQPGPSRPRQETPPQERSFVPGSEEAYTRGWGTTGDDGTTLDIANTTTPAAAATSSGPPNNPPSASRA